MKRKTEKRQKEKTEGLVEIKGGFTLGNQNGIHIRNPWIERVVGKKDGKEALLNNKK